MDSDCTHPATPSTASIGLATVVYCLAAIGLNVQFGYTGLLNFGQAGVHGGRRLRPGHHDRHLRPAAVARHPRRPRRLPSCSALLLGVPTLRLRADYLAIVTIAAAEIMRLIVRLGDASREYFGGSRRPHGFAGDFRDLEPVRPARATVG